MRWRRDIDFWPLRYCSALHLDIERISGFSVCLPTDEIIVIVLILVAIGRKIIVLRWNWRRAVHILLLVLLGGAALFIVFLWYIAPSGGRVDARAALP
jgi:hypothetical protein